MRRPRPIIVVLASMVMLLVSQAMPVSANPPVRFGAGLNNTFDTTGPVSCDGGAHSCTWIMNAVFNASANKLTAPKDGTIHKLLVVAGAPDTVKVQLARANGSHQGKIVRKGATIHPVGLDSTAHKIETFSVSIAVKKGDRLAINDATSHIVRCFDGGPHTLQYQPPLPVGGSFTSESSDSGCYLMLEAQY
jgi:hypothetical protein